MQYKIEYKNKRLEQLFDNPSTLTLFVNKNATVGSWSALCKMMSKYGEFHWVKLFDNTHLPQYFIVGFVTFVSNPYPLEHYVAYDDKERDKIIKELNNKLSGYSYKEVKCYNLR